MPTSFLPFKSFVLTIIFMQTQQLHQLCSQMVRLDCCNFCDWVFGFFWLSDDISQYLFV